MKARVIKRCGKLQTFPVMKGNRYMGSVYLDRWNRWRVSFGIFRFETFSSFFEARDAAIMSC